MAIGGRMAIESTLGYVLHHLSIFGGVGIGVIIFIFILIFIFIICNFWGFCWGQIIFGFICVYTYICLDEVFGKRSVIGLGVLSRC